MTLWIAWANIWIISFCIMSDIQLSLPSTHFLYSGRAWVRSSISSYSIPSRVVSPRKAIPLLPRNRMVRKRSSKQCSAVSCFLARMLNKRASMGTSAKAANFCIATVCISDFSWSQNFSVALRQFEKPPFTKGLYFLNLSLGRSFFSTAFKQTKHKMWSVSFT